MHTTSSASPREDGAPDERRQPALVEGRRLPRGFGPRDKAGYVLVLDGLGVDEQAAQGDGVAEELYARDVRVPDHDGHHDEEHVLQDARQGQDEARRLADLQGRMESAAVDKGRPRAA